MKSLVTGGAGFIGSHLCDFLLTQGHEVVCIDNLLTGNKDNIKHCLSNQRFLFIKDNVLNIERLNLGKVDFIFHLASPASPVWYQRYPLETLLVNTVGTFRLLKLALRFGSRFLFASTSEVYGDPLEHPQKETYWGNVNSFGPRSCYDEAKRCGEAFIYSFLKRRVKARVVRIFNTYGPRMDAQDGRVISNFVVQTLRNEPLTVFGKGDQTRSFCYVTDMVRGIYRASVAEGYDGEIFNLGNPQEIKIGDLAERVSKIAGVKLRIKYKKLPQDDPSKRCPVIGKAKVCLKWKPLVGIEDGLRKTIDYFRKKIVC